MTKLHLLTDITDFDKLNKVYPALQRDNNAAARKLYVKTIAELAKDVETAVEKQKVTPGKKNTALPVLRRNLKKNNKLYETDIAEYEKDPEKYTEPEEEVVVVQTTGRKAPRDTVAQETVTDDGGFTMVGAGGRAVSFTPESILKHLRSILESRGRKNTDKLEQIRILERLQDVAVSPYQTIRILLVSVATRFDLTSATGNTMAQEQWKMAQQELQMLLKTLEENTNLVVVDNAEDWEDDDRQPEITPGTTFKIPGSVVSLVERLDDELTKVLQAIDPHTAEYVERLTDETSLYAIIVRVMAYCERIQTTPDVEAAQDIVNRAIQRRLEHLYFKPSQVIGILEETIWKQLPEASDSKIAPRTLGSDSANLVKTLCTYLYQHSEGIIRARAMLSQAYFLALHDNYYQSRDMLLMSHLQETIGSFDVSTQILYNRTLTQIGLCAFRAGLVYEAQNTLQDICGSQRQKELLAQGLQLQRYSQITPEQERLERQRQLPFHMHINLELLECIYLTCSMLLEIPLLAQVGSSPDIKKRVISKSYRRMLEYHERQIFTGPPENTRDHVMQASKALASGEWQKAADLITSIKIWELLPDAEKTKSMLTEQIQEEGLRTYLFTYAPFYDTLGISALAGMFSLTDRRVTALVSRMVSHEELAAALDQINGAIIFRKGVELSRLQSLALTLSDKASGLIESNERVLEQRTQGTANAFERQGRGGREGGRGRGGRGRGGGDRGARRGGGGGGNAVFSGGALGSAIRA